MIDKQSKEELLYEYTTIQAYQMNIGANSETTFPLDHEIDETAITIDKHSNNYTVGYNTTPQNFINLYTRGSQIRNVDTPDNHPTHGYKQHISKIKQSKYRALHKK